MMGAGLNVRVALGIPTLSPQGAERTKVLVERAHAACMRTYVIDNGGHYSRACTEFTEACADNVVPALPSVAASWNYVLRAATYGDIVLLVNDDVEVTPPGLAALALEAALSCLRWRWGHGPLELVGAFPHAFACFAMHHGLLDTVGYFDEQFAPAYYEDTDYLRRMELLGVKLRQVDIGLRHDKPGTTNRDLGKLDWKKSTEHVRKLFEAKWGTKQRPFKYPYNKEPNR